MSIRLARDIQFVPRVYGLHLRIDRLTAGIVKPTAPIIHGRSELLEPCVWLLWVNLRTNWREETVGGRAKRDLMAGAAVNRRKDCIVMGLDKETVAIEMVKKRGWMKWRPGSEKEGSGVNRLHGMTSLCGLGAYVTVDSDWVTGSGTGHAWGIPQARPLLLPCPPHILFLSNLTLCLSHPESSKIQGSNI